VLDLAALDRREPVTGGAATSVWRIEAGRSHYALRVFRAHERHVLEREQVAMRCARAAGLPVPRVFAIGTFDARPAQLIEWCRGRTMLDLLQRRPSDAVTAGLAFGRLQARLHRVTAPAGLRSQWIDWPAAAEPALAARLRGLSVVPDRLLHLDFHPLNVLVEGATPSALLDWTNAHAGDPRADVARTATILRLMPRVLGQSVGIRIGGLVVELAWRAGYGRLGGEMAPFYAWAGGAMLHDLAARHTRAQLEPVERWTRAWRRRAGLPSSGR
jgi:aminoglycoside phosphotransferase (APT) family kinase protein